ncbi:MAG TPA: hypothetical protein VKU39_19785 [Streptosporangiaceae bacterium]|nr:hypothetical protein [Streptosporangiaceae bacterium]
MYGWLWRHLPGSPPARAATIAIAAALVLIVLWFVAFPWAATHLPLDGGPITG